MIISLRGTNGSGKSTVVRELMAAGKVSPIFGVLGPRNPEAYQCLLPKVKKPLFILGPYNVECGGCDAIIPYDIILDLLDKYAPRGHVLFEGVIVASVMGRVGDWMEKHKDDVLVAFLTTPLEECIRRVESRRRARGDLRPFNPKNLTSKYNTILKMRDRAKERGLRVLELPEKGAPPSVQLLDELRAA